MSDFITAIYLVASANDLPNDLPYLQKIIETIYKNKALLTRDWIGAAIARKKRTPDIEGIDWTAIVNESLEAIKQSDLVIAEVSLSDANQGVQTYIATQYKKPTLVVTRSQVEDRFISGIEETNKYITVKQYSSVEELEQIVTTFIQQNSIPAKDLRFNLFLNRRILKYLREKSNKTGQNQSEIIREILEREVRYREGQ